MHKPRTQKKPAPPGVPLTKRQLALFLTILEHSEATGEALEFDLTADGMFIPRCKICHEGKSHPK